jgi:hypothetical protein
MRYFKRLVLNSLAWAFVILSLIYGLAEVRAAEYNFYFNNAEQGSNSSASPSVTVKTTPEGKIQSVTAPPSEAPENEENSSQDSVASESVAEASHSKADGIDALLNPIRNLIPPGMKSGF